LLQRSAASSRKLTAFATEYCPASGTGIAPVRFVPPFPFAPN
jgi:hypothetical protein